ncbi:MAG: hypothetical protein R6U26_02170 [Candidatus Undinarchaeales archaeon]
MVKIDFAKKHPYFVLAIAIVFIVIFFVGVETAKNMNNAPTEKTEQELCNEAGGTWEEMPNACVDSCESAREDMMCAQVITKGCNCGEGMCWNGETCEEI